MSIDVHWQENCQFKVVVKDRFELFVDVESQSAPCPTELLLSALGTCCATDVVPGLQKHNVVVDSLSNRVTYTLTESEPRLYQPANLHFVIKTDGVTEETVKRVAKKLLKDTVMFV